MKKLKKWIYINKGDALPKIKKAKPIIWKYWNSCQPTANENTQIINVLIESITILVVALEYFVIDIPIIIILLFYY